jgi:hypothetical protein
MIRIAIQRVDRPSDPATGRRRKRRTVVKLGLAALALVGIGAGVTAAAWTDDAFFSAGASSASVKLQGALANCDVVANGCAWSEADSAAPVTLPAAFLQGLVPAPDNTTAVPKTQTVWLKNAGSSALTVAVTCTKSGTLFAGTTPLVPTLDSGLASTTCSGASNGTLALAAGAVKSVVVTVTIPAAWPQSYAGQTGSSLTLDFSGTAS